MSPLYHDTVDIFPELSMRHLPFINALASAADTSDPVWRDAAGGYLALRFFDCWLEDGPDVIAGDPGISVLRAEVTAVPDADPSVRETLLTFVTIMSEAKQADPVAVSESLLTYGKYLESAGRLELAADVYRTLAEALDPPSGTIDPGLAATAFVLYGFVSRLLGDFDLAGAAYDRSHTLATQVGDLAAALRARIGTANLLRGRGNLGDSEALLDSVVKEAAAANLSHMQSGALHSRGAARQKRGRYAEAMIDYFASYELAPDETERELILGDLAACALDAGYHRMARDAHRRLADTTHTPILRLSSLINLLEIAARDGDAVEFDRLQRDIQAYAAEHPVPVEHAVHLTLHTAHGTERFGTQEAAITAYQIVIALARDAGIHQVEFEAEERLAALMGGAAGPASRVL